MAFYEKQKWKQVTSGYKIKMSGLHHGLLDVAFRHCRIMERDGARLVRRFTGKVPRSQVARKQVKQDIVRWCELHPMRLPQNGGAVVLDLDYIWKPA